jgi:hypothetical protein
MMETYYPNENGDVFPPEQGGVRQHSLWGVHYKEGSIYCNIAYGPRSKEKVDIIHQSAVNIIFNNPWIPVRDDLNWSISCYGCLWFDGKKVYDGDFLVFIENGDVQFVALEGEALVQEDENRILHWF